MTVADRALAAAIKLIAQLSLEVIRLEKENAKLCDQLTGTELELSYAKTRLDLYKLKKKGI